MAAEAQTATMIANKLPDLLHELPFEVPSEFPDYGTADTATVYKLFKEAVRGINLLYEDLTQHDVTATIAGAYRVGEDPDFPSRSKGNRILKAGRTAIMLASEEGFFDVAPEDEEVNWRYLQTDKMFIGAPMPELGEDASVAVCLSADSSREEPDSSEATYGLGAAWEVRIPSLRALRAFGIHDEAVTSLVPSMASTIVEQFFGAQSTQVVKDLPVIHSDDVGRRWQESEYRQGIINGAYVRGSLRNRLLTMGAVILEPYEHTSFKALGIR